jgi:hypothetical protein
MSKAQRIGATAALLELPHQIKRQYLTAGSQIYLASRHDPA